MIDVVLWSGGADSTYLLDEFGRKSSSNKPVLAYTVILENMNVIKNKKEKEAREKIKKYFKDKKYHIEYFDIKIKGKHLVEHYSNQPLEFVLSTVPYLPVDCILHTGHICEDSVWHKRHELIQAFKWANKVKCADHTTTLSFDLEWMHKDTLLANINKKLLKLIWTCEEPTDAGKACNKCIKCLELKNNMVRNNGMSEIREK